MFFLHDKDNLHGTLLDLGGIHYTHLISLKATIIIKLGVWNYLIVNLLNKVSFFQKKMLIIMNKKKVNYPTLNFYIIRYKNQMQKIFICKFFNINKILWSFIEKNWNNVRNGQLMQKISKVIFLIRLFSLKTYWWIG